MLLNLIQLVYLFVTISTIIKLISMTIYIPIYIKIIIIVKNYLKSIK